MSGGNAVLAPARLRGQGYGCSRGMEAWGRGGCLRQSAEGKAAGSRHTARCLPGESIPTGDML